MNTKALTASWRSTALGIIAGLVVLLPEAQALLDGDPATSFSVEVITGGLALMGFGAITRDHSVNSETAGAK